MSLLFLRLFAHAGLPSLINLLEYPEMGVDDRKTLGVLLPCAAISTYSQKLTRRVYQALLSV